MIELIKKFLKSFSLGRLIYPPLNKIYRLYSVPKRRLNMKRNGYKVLDDVYRICEENAIGCFAVFGSLLGYIRAGGFIPHDCDLDFGVMPDVSPAHLTKIFVEKNGFRFLHAFSYHGEVTEVTLQWRGVPMDFIFYKSDEVKSWCTVYHWTPDAGYTDPRQNSVKHVNQARITKLKTIEVHGARVMVPENAEEVLCSEFGEGWRVPDPSFKPSQQPGNVYLDDFGYMEPYEVVVGGLGVKVSDPSV